MRKYFKQLFMLCMFVPLVACAQEEQAPYKEGEHYFELREEVETRDPDKVEVLELFWYGCSHCFALEPRLKTWEKVMPDYVDFHRMPAVMGRGWDVHGKAYYAAEQLGLVEKTHEALFNAIHRNRAPLFDNVALAGFYSQYGVEELAFNKAYNSFSVNSKVQQAQLKQRKYQARGVPAIIVNGKYRVDSQKDMLKVVDYLIQKERGL